MQQINITISSIKMIASKILRKVNILLTHKTNRLFETKYWQIGYCEFVIFVFLFVEFLLLTNNQINDSNTKTAYLLTYEFGFNSQSLVGSIVSLFTDKITSHLIYMIATVSFLILALQISLVLGVIIRQSGQSVKSSIIIFIVLFLASPLSVTYLLGMHTERLDVYWICITLLALIFLKSPVFRWAIPLLCAIAVSVHQGYMSTYMPALAILMLYEVYKTKYSLKSITVFTLSCFTMIVLFIYFQFVPFTFPFDNAVDFAKHLSNKSDFIASAPMLHVGFFAPFKEWLYEYVLPFTASYALPVSISFLAFSLPLIIIFVTIWKYSFKYTKNKFLKFIFSLCAAAPLAFLPAAVLANDWDRYWAAAVNNQFILVFYLIHSKEATVIDIVKKVGDFFEKHFLLLVLIIVFTNSLTYSHTSMDIFYFIKNRKATEDLIVNYFNKRVYGY